MHVSSAPFAYSPEDCLRDLVKASVMLKGLRFLVTSNVLCREFRNFLFCIIVLNLFLFVLEGKFPHLGNCRR